MLSVDSWGPLCLQDGNAALRAATLLGNADAVETLLAAGANPSQETGRGTALIAAASEGDTRMLAMLLEAGADVNQQTSSGESHTRHAAQQQEGL